MFTQRPRIDLIYGDLSSARRSSIVSLDACACILPEPGVFVYLSHCPVQLIPSVPSPTIAWLLDLHLRHRSTVQISSCVLSEAYARRITALSGQIHAFLVSINFIFLSPPVFSEHI
jgi:hypothetical protein